MIVDGRRSHRWYDSLVEKSDKCYYYCISHQSIPDWQLQVKNPITLLTVAGDVAGYTLTCWQRLIDGGSLRWHMEMHGGSASVVISNQNCFGVSVVGICLHLFVEVYITLFSSQIIVWWFRQCSFSLKNHTSLLCHPLSWMTQLRLEFPMLAEKWHASESAQTPKVGILSSVSSPECYLWSRRPGLQKMWHPC